MIFIGNQTSCWAASPAEPFDYAIAQAFDAFEWFPDKKPGVGWDENDLSAATRGNIRETSRARGIRTSVHARWQANPLLPESQELFSRDIALARDLGAVLLNLHFEHENGVTAFVHAIVPLIDQTAEAGLQLAIENTPHHSPEQFNEIFARLQELTSVPTDRVGMCLDIGHANLSSTTPNDYLGFCDRLNPSVPIIHAHLHENWGDADSHLPLFTGPAARNDSGIRGLLARFKNRGFSGSIILEQWPHPPSLLNTARNRLLELWGPNDRPKVNDEPPAQSIVQEIVRRESCDLMGELVAGDRRCRSWREKLELVNGLLAREKPTLTADHLVLIAIYLRFLSTGQITCSEDGRHFRPVHHATLASQIYGRLARARTPENEFILRKIYPWLPSSSPTFQRPEPLTRIRDIAHRNDIDSELKREIKTRLQNKLHRCAGPEDLATSSELLRRFTAEGANYPAEFVEQFKIFHQELKEFFNARSLDERLGALLESAEGQLKELISGFLQKKDASNLEDQLADLRILTELRQLFGQRIGQPQDPVIQDFILADIALEDFAFALVSQIINQCDNADGASAGPSRMEALRLSIRNLVLSGVDPSESGAVESELRAWGNCCSNVNRRETLRQRATLLRCRRLAEEFSARTLALFSGKVETLGRALGVDDRAIRVFSEADIRSHLVFQVSKLSDALLREIRKGLKLSPWDVVVSGTALGMATALESLTAWKRTSGRPSVLLLKSATGDEEIPKSVTGMALAHEMPHLAHLSVRARQAGIVFATCEDTAEFEQMQSLNGREIRFSAQPDKVAWDIHDGKGAMAEPRVHTSTRVPQVRLEADPAWLSLESVTTDLAGGKAHGARRLAELAQDAKAGFRTPSGLAIPFGVLEAALNARPEISAEYLELTKRLDRSKPDEFKADVGRLRQIIQTLTVPESITKEVRRRFENDSALVVRSSANCEDLEEFAGAGLYHSVVNVPPGEVASAILNVWSSLWTQRAAESRRSAKIPHEQAHMAVLIQELVDAEFSFVLHTVNPITHNRAELYAELVVGLGETLASAAVAGSPYRLTCNKETAAATVLAFANFSQAARPVRKGGLRRETLDYSHVELSRQPGHLERLGQQLARVGSLVERALNGPQDIEGAVLRGLVYLVQARAQQGLPAAGIA